MSTTTTNLGLFKYDPSTDGKEVFSITNALNNNWDILDTKAGAPDTVVSGSTWYRTFSNGWKEQGGLITLLESSGGGDTGTSWSQPTLSANGTLGGDSFAVSATGTNASNYAWKAFDNSTTTHWQGNHVVSESNPEDLIFYNPNPLKVVVLRLYPKAGNGYYFTGSIHGSNDNNTFTTLVNSFTASYQSSSVPYTDIVVNSPDFYKYYKIHVIENHADTTYAYITECKITATQSDGGGGQVTTNTITFPTAFTTTNYSYTLSFENVSNGDACITSKTTTSMNVTNCVLGVASWTACGY